MTIWNLHEPSWREYKSAAWYVDRLKAEGFEVEAGSGGMPTAFAAEWSNGDGPTIGGYAEYDAVPGRLAGSSAAPREHATGRQPSCRRPYRSAFRRSAWVRFAGFLAAKHVMETQRHQGAAEVLRRAGREDVRLQAGSRRQGLL